MQIKVIFSEDDYQRDNFDNIKMAVYFYLARLDDYLEKVEKHCEAQKEKARYKGVCKQRRNKTVNARKSS